MSLEFYIEAKISDRKNNLAVSRTECGRYFTICWWRSWFFSDIRDGIIEIANKHSGKNYTNEHYKIPLPESALHEVYGYLLENSFVPESEYKYPDSMAQEMSNVENACKLRHFIWGLECIKHNNTFVLNDIKKHIPDENDWKNLNENPQTFEWKFRIFNSY